MLVSFFTSHSRAVWVSAIDIERCAFVMDDSFVESPIKLNQLRDFVAVARAGGVRPAARDSGQAQPALTKSIQQLERTLAVPLFVRTGKKLVLTEFGNALLLRARAVMNDLRRAEQEINQMRTQRHGQVSFSMGGISLMAMLPGALETFQRRFTDVSVRAVERPFDQALSDLRLGELDFAVLPDPPGPLGEEFISTPLYVDQYTVIGRRGHPRRGTRHLEDLLEESWIATRQGALKAAGFETQFRLLGLPIPRIAIQCESIAGVLALLQQTDYLAILPRRWLRPEFVSSCTEEIRLDTPLEENRSFVVRRSDLPLSPAAAGLVASLEIEARGLATWPTGHCTPGCAGGGARSLRSRSRLSKLVETASALKKARTDRSAIADNKATAASFEAAKKEVPAGVPAPTPPAPAPTSSESGSRK